MSSKMTPENFAAKWRESKLRERQGYQEHWRDVCLMLDQPTPSEVDTSGDQEYCFEKGAGKVSDGSDGWADVWWKGKFGVEYKGKHKDLHAAYTQLLEYREALGNPPLLIVTDMECFKIHTNFTDTEKRIYEFDLEAITSGDPVSFTPPDPATPPMTAIEVLRTCFDNPDKLRPTRTAEHVTTEAAATFARIADSMRQRGIDPQKAAHFLMKLLFCLFAEDVGLLGEDVFERLVKKAGRDPEKFAKHLRELFVAMKDGGEFLLVEIPYFNGGLFDGADVIEMTEDEIKDLSMATGLNWANIEPSIFGTLFERSLDPAQRAQLGAHYTSREDILLIVEPVLMRPLRRQWEAVKKEAGPLRNETADIRNQLSKLKGEGKERDRLNKALKATQKKLGILYSDFAHSISQVKVLDPACGSGNFLYVALRQLKYLQREVIVEARDAGVAGIMPDADPGQLYGMEINPYAHELAQVVVWIGYIQWHVQNGYGFPREPILRSLDNIKRMDALLVWTDTPVTPARHADESRHPETNERLDPGKARHTGESRYPETNGELGPDFRRDDGQKVSPPATPAKAGVQKSPEKLDPDFRRDDADVALPATNSKPEARRSEWPEADVIIGNPPFLGGKRLRNSLGDEYVDALFKAYGKDVALEADLSVYWHERARALIEKGKVKRAGLLATQGIRGGANQKTLRRILETGNIFEAWSDRDWFLAGAAVHVSIICQDAKAETEHLLDGQCVPAIHADLSSAHGADVTRAVRLSENFDLGFMGDTKGGKFDIDPETAKALLAGKNPNGKSNKSVVVPWVNGADLTRRSRGWYIIDFNEMPLEEACQYESPFEYVRQYVFPERMQNNRQSYRDKWWVHVEPRPAMRAALEPLTRFIGTATTAKYRLFSWFTKPTLPDHAIIVFAREDDYFFGVLHSVAHERWALELGTQLEDRPRYTPTTCFETFPFSWPPGKEKQNDPQVKAIAAAAKSLNDQRETWLNPKGISEAELKKRTLTNLYNARPEWLHQAHIMLDRAVFAAYGWSDLDPENLYATRRPNAGESKEQAKARETAAEQEMLKRLLALNHERAGEQQGVTPGRHPDESRDPETTKDWTPASAGVTEKKATAAKKPKKKTAKKK